MSVNPADRVSGGGSVQGGGEARGRRVTGVRIDETGNGKTFKVKKGQNVIVTLPSNASTGYKWRVLSTNRTFGYPVSDNTIVEGNPRSRPVGSGGVQQLVWSTKGPLPMTGAHRVTLAYARGEGTPAKTFTFTIEM